MARQFSIKALAEVIADDTDSQSAAQLFGKRLSYIEKVQQTEDYRRALELAKKRESTQLTKRLQDLDEGDVAHIPMTRASKGVEHTELRSYQTGTPPEKTFIFKFYKTPEDVDTDTEVPDTEKPTGLTFEPETPIQDGRPHFVKIRYTPIVVAQQWYTLFGIE